MNRAILLIFIAVFSAMHANETIEKLHRRMIEEKTLLCVGLDPDPKKYPEEIIEKELSVEEKSYLFLKEIIDLTSEHVCAYKLQKAFYDTMQGGHDLLQKTVTYIKENNPQIAVFIDCKVGDIDNTMDAYVDNLFGCIKADGIVVNPYMGDDVFAPFLQDPEKSAIVLVQTSNPKAKVVQELVLSEGDFLWERILNLMLQRWNKNENLIPVISSNSEDYDYKSIRKLIPQKTPILFVGIGAQGGDLSILRELFNEERSGVFINSSRGILYPYAVQDKDWREKVVRAAIKLKEEINAIRYE